MMKDSIIHGIGIASCTLIAGLCIFAGSKYVNHLNTNADYAIEDTKLSLAAIGNSISEHQDSAETPESIVLQGVKYLYVDDESVIDSELFEKLSKDGTILVMYEGSVYVTEDAYDKYISETPTDATSAKADNTAEGESNRKSDNEYIVLDVDGNLIYLVEKGDTLTDVSSRISYSVDEIAEYNHIKDVNLIYAGETLRVPVDDTQADAN